MRQRVRSPWFMYFTVPTRPSVRMFCFHYGGGSAATFKDWHRALPEHIELIAVELPGRGRRFAERPMSRMEDVVREVSSHITNLLDLPYFLFGHSNGALLAYELACILQARGQPLPVRLIVSARAAPHLPLLHPPIHALPEQELIEKLRTFEGTPADVLEDRELMGLLLPMLRADFALAERYEFSPRPPLICPISALGGSEDAWITEEDVRSWRTHTRAHFDVTMFAGGHFFLHHSHDQLMSRVNAIIGCRGYAP